MNNSTSLSHKSQIQNRLDRIVAEGKDPNTSQARKEILRRFYKFWKLRLEQDPPSVINIEPIKPMVLEYLAKGTKDHGYFTLRDLLDAFPQASQSMMNLALQELSEDKQILTEKIDNQEMWAVALKKQT